jgi:CHAT domain-containing protein/Tfp pilus assembly protein PilF
VPWRIAVALVLLAAALQPPAPSREHDEIRRLLRAADYAAAESRSRALVAALERTDPDSLDLARALDLMVQSLVEGGKPADPAALPGATRAVALKEKIAGPHDPAVAASLGNLGLVLRRQGKLDEARQLYERARDIYERAFGGRHPEVARTLAALSGIASNGGDFARARELGERALQIAASAEPRDPIVEAVAANNLALALFQLNDHAGAQQRLEQALHAYEAALGADHPEVAKTLNNLANVVGDSGDLSEARRLYERSIAIQERRQGRDHPDVALNVNNLAEIFFLVGDFESSAALFERALRVLERAYGPGHTRVAMALGNLGQVRAAQGDMAQAQSLYARALAIREKAVGPDHPSLVYTLTGFAELRARRGEHEPARAMFERALAISERAFGADHPATALALQGLGDLRLAAGDAVGAEAAIARALRIRADLLGGDHPLVAESRASMALVLARTGRPSAAFDGAIEAERVSRAHLQVTAQALAERQALSYAEHRVSGADVVLSLLADRRVGGADAVRRAWDAVVRSRALVLEEMAARRRLVAAASDADLTRLAGDLAGARQRLAGLLVRSAADPASREHVARAVRERDAAERALAERSLDFRTGQAHVRTGLAEASARLPTGAALVAYVRFRRSAATTSAGDEYLAFVGSADREPAAIPLGSAQAIDDRIQRWRRSIATQLDAGFETGRSERVHRELGSELRRVMWDPLRDVLTGQTQVFIVPAGPLHLVSWGALPDRNGTYLVEGPQQIHYLSAERDLARTDRPSGTGLLLIDNPAFGPAPVSTPASAAGGGCTDLGSLRFDPLPESRREGDAIATLWQSLGRSTRLTGGAASEAQVREQIRGSRVVHFATHGFFLGAWCGPASRGANPHPLLLAGLALAGANARGTRSPVDDGVLLAEEIATLDMRGVEWAVLSACDTGAGVIAAGEELLGLRRAFQVAGVSTVIVSLWPVDDELTRRWMSEVYRERFVANLQTPAAIRQATMKILASRRAAKQSTHPAYWGAFVAAGL